MIKRNRVRKLTVLFVSALWAATAVEAQTTWYVDDDAPNDPGPGDPTISDPLEDGSAEHPFDAIQEGIDAAVNGHTVLVLDGTYTGNGNTNPDFGGRLITVRSENGPDTCIIDCHGNGGCFYFHSGETLDAVLEGVAVIGAVGAIGTRNSSPTVINCIFSGNINDFGGAMPNWHSSLTVVNCTFIGNTAECGGAMCNVYGSPTIINCTFTGNTAPSGGAIYNWSSSPTVINCTFSGNSASNSGGGMRNDYGSPTIINCTFTGNAAAIGGAIYNANGSPTVINCTFTGNSANNGGGGLYWYDNDPIISNCTITHNSAGGEGGGVACGSDSAASLTNCIVWDNSAALGPQIAVLGGESAELTVSYNNVAGGEEAVYVAGGSTLVWGPGNIDADPLFVDPDGPDNDPNTWEDNDYRLSPVSPCIDAGCNCGVPTDAADADGDGDTDEYVPFDLAGEGRFFDDPDTPDTGSGLPPIVDMGAYEFGGSDLPPCRGDLDGDRDVDAADLSALLANYGMVEGATGIDGDMDCDGDVSLDDLAQLLAVYGSTCED